MSLLSDRLLSYVVSFTVIAFFWVDHHRKFRVIARYDEGLLWVNLLFLFFIVLLPFTTEVIGQFPDDRVAVSLYGASLTGTALAGTVLWWHAGRRRLLRDDVGGSMIRRGYLSGWVLIFAFSLSTLAAFLDVRLAAVLWIIPLPVALAVEVGRHRATRERT